MEDLLRSLRNLGLKPPDSSQLLELIDDDAQVQEKLVKVLALSSVGEDFDEGGGEGAGALMGHELLQEAVTALLDNFRKTIAKQQQAVRNEKDGKPKKIRWPPRKALFARQTAAIQRSERDTVESPDWRPRLVFDTSESFYSTSSLSQLTRMECLELTEAPKRYQGRYLLCKVVTPLLLYAGVTFIGEDPSGNAVPISVSHFTSNFNLSTEQVSQLLPLGTILAIREPFVSVHHQAKAGPSSSKGDQGVQVDSPTDIIVLKEEDCSDIRWREESPSKAPSATDWLSSSTLSRAGKAASSEQVEREVERLLSVIRAGEAYREIRRQKRKGVLVSKRTEGLVLFHLDAWEAAREVFAQAKEELEAGRNDSEARDMAAAADFSINITQLSNSQASLRCQLRMSQASQGLSTEDLRCIYLATVDGVTLLDASTFIGPVAIRNIPGAGRGLITTRDVKPGEVLLCCKAVCASYPDDEECQGAPLLRLNLDNGVVSTTSQVRAQTKLIHAIVDRADLALPVLGLTAGPSTPYSDYVSQEYPLRTSFDLESDLDHTQRADVDAAYIDGVLRFNAFGPARVRPKAQGPLLGAQDSEKSTMSHPLPAIINHACLPNASSIFLSNIVITRALTNLATGTEVVHQYVRGEESVIIRSAKLSKHGFECACPLCIMDRADGMEKCSIRAQITQGESKAILDRSTTLLRNISIRQMASMVRESDKIEEAHDDVLCSLQSLIDRIRATYAIERTFRPDLFVVMTARTKHLARKNMHDAILSAIEAFACVGGVVDLDNETQPLVELPKLHFGPALDLMLFIATLLTHSNEEENAVSWVRAAFWAHECTTGGGVDVFLDRGGLEIYQPAIDLWQSSL
ncbi:hypothetical protein CBS101457_001122 [Exobasidium rhododendri]|nr:hypothetical protein CBS101457_001122 [Exobasidium rhododendri]